MKETQDDLNDLGFVEESAEDLADIGFVSEGSEDLSDLGFTEEAEDQTPSQLESLGRGAAQGVSLGFGDELGAAALTPLELIRSKLSKLMPDSPEAVDAELRSQGFTGDIQEPSAKETYQDLRDASREDDTVAKEANSGTFLAGEIAGGIAPAIVSGGGTAAANVGKSLGTPLLKESMKQAAKIGAGYGAASGAGYSEADLTEGEVGGFAGDTTLGAAIGAGAGATMPVLGKGLKAAAKQGNDFLKGIGNLIPGSESIKAAFQYGRQGKKITSDVLDDDLTKLSRSILDNIKKDKTANNLKAVKDKLDEIGIVVDGEEAILRAVDDMERAAKGDYLGIQNKEVLPKLKELVGYDAQMAKLNNKAEKNIIKKVIEAEGRENQAVISGEKSLAKKAIQSGDDLQTITDVNKPMSDLEIPFDTSKGSFGGAKGSFKNADGDEYVQQVLKDTTPYQPVVSKILGPDGRPIIKTLDKGTGKISALVGNIEDKLELDLKNMTISETEALRKQLNVVNKMAKMQGSADDPILQRGQQLASKLKELTDDVVEKYGDKSLIDQRARFSDIYSAEELLGVSKRLHPRNDINQTLKEVALGDKLGYEKAFKSRQEGQLGEKLLGKKIIPEETKKQLHLIRKLNTIVGRENQETISSSGLYKKAVGDIPNLIGRGVKKSADMASPITSPAKNVVDAIDKMTKEQVSGLASKMTSSQNKGQQFLGGQLTKAIEQGGDSGKQAIWALSQTAAFRELVKREAPAMAEEMNNAIGIGSAEAAEADASLDTRLSPEIQEVSRDPAAVSENFAETIGQRESNNNYNAENKLGYLGKYQFGGMALQDLGYKDSKGKWLGKDGIGNKEDFLNNTEVQEKAFSKWVPMITGYLKNKGTLDYVGKEIDGLKITEDGLVAAAHLVGAGAVSKMLKSGKIPEDANGTKATDYMKMFQDNSPEESAPDLNSMLQGYADQEVEAPAEEEIKEVEKAIDSVNQLQSSGDGTPVDQIENLMGKIDKLKLREEDKNELENEAVNMAGFSDGNRLKELLRKISELK